MIAIDLPPDIEKRFEGVAHSIGISLETYLRRALIDHLDDIEDIADAERALDDIEHGRSRTISLDDLERELGLDD